MHVAAQRTLEAGDEWKRIRREALKACGGILGEVGRVMEEPEGFGERGTKRAAGEDVEGEVDVLQVEAKRRRVENDSEFPLGVYEPQTGIVLCELSMSIYFYRLTVHVPYLKTVQTRSLCAAVGKKQTSPGNQTRGASWAAQRLAAVHGAWHGSIRSWSSLLVKRRKL